MNTPLVLLDLFDTFCLSKKLLRFFLQLTFEARAPVVWGAGEGKHLSQPDVQKEGPLLFLSLESVCGPSAAPLQTAYLSLPGFSHPVLRRGMLSKIKIQRKQWIYACCWSCTTRSTKGRFQPIWWARERAKCWREFSMFPRILYINISQRKVVSTC